MGARRVRPQGEGRITIEDVAKMANVSIATVSRVLKDEGSVRPENRDRVKAAIKALDYTPSMAARQIHGVDAITVGVITTRSSNLAFGNPYFSDVLGAIGEVIEARDCYLQLHSYSDMASETQKTVALYRSGRVNGLILLSSRVYDPLVMTLVRSEIPFTLIGRVINMPDEQISYVNTDNIVSAQQAVEYVIGKGHRHIGILSGPKQYVVSQDRLMGYRNALMLHGLPFRESYDEVAGYSHQDAKEATERLVRNNPELTAIFASDDLKGVAALEQLREMGIDVPGQMAVLGFDDYEIGRVVRPALTTVEVPVKELGRTAANMLIDRIEGKHTGARQVILDTRLIVRESV
ncbi:MAG: LacI family DNA-binding transcriptional regulator [Aristaeellaceae bacterium]